MFFAISNNFLCPVVGGLNLPNTIVKASEPRFVFSSSPLPFDFCASGSAAATCLPVTVVAFALIFGAGCAAACLGFGTSLPGFCPLVKNFKSPFSVFAMNSPALSYQPP